MGVGTLSGPWAKVRSASATDSSFPSKVPTATEPTGAGVLDFSPGSQLEQLVLVPYGTGANNDTFDLRVIGWRLISDLYVPVLLAQFAVTLSQAVGVAGKSVINTERFADTLSITYGNSNVDTSVVSPTGDLIAHAIVDVKGFNKLEFTFDLGGTTTDANCLYARL